MLRQRVPPPFLASASASAGLGATLGAPGQANAEYRDGRCEAQQEQKREPLPDRLLQPLRREPPRHLVLIDPAEVDAGARRQRVGVIEPRRRTGPIGQRLDATEEGRGALHRVRAE
jgi:hypothetical protein